MVMQTRRSLPVGDLWRASLETPYGLAQAVRFTAKNTGLSIDALAEAFYLCQGAPMEVTVTEQWIEMKCRREHGAEPMLDTRQRTTDSQRLAEQTRALLNPDLIAVVEQCEPFLDMSVRESAALVAADLMLESRGWRSVPDIEQNLEIGYVCLSRAFYLLDQEYSDALFDAVRLHADANVFRKRSSGRHIEELAYV